MRSFRSSMRAACVAGALCLATAALAQEPAAAPQGEGLLASVTVTATVTKVDQQTREVSLKAHDGQEYSVVASDDVENLAQMKAGDVVTATYAEALVYEVRKGGQAVAPETAVAGSAAEPGAKPAGAVAWHTTVTVVITAIDSAVPSITFQGPAGNTRTIKVRHPEKLEGVKVGDTVEVTYTEALAIRIEEAAPKK